MRTQFFSGSLRQLHLLWSLLAFHDVQILCRFMLKSAVSIGRGSVQKIEVPGEMEISVR